jgi:hypothetical protein
MNTTTVASVTTPPREHLDQVARALDAAGIEWALGGSALCMALGLASRVGDWDLTTDAAPEAIVAALRDLTPAPELHGNSGIHADHKVVCFGGTVEVISRFAFFGEDDAVIRIPTIVTGKWQGYPVGSPLAWAVAYTLMAGEKEGYDVKAERLFALVEARGEAPAAERDALLAHPLPADVARRLRSR